MATPTISQRRLLEEREAITSAYPAMLQKSADLEVPTFEGSVDIGGVSYFVRLLLPKNYPSSPPEIGEINEPGGRMTHPQGGMHRFPDGTICLFPHGNDPQAWHRERRAVEALDRFVELKKRERTPSHSLFRAGWRLVVPPSIAQLMLSPGSHGTILLRSAANGQGDRFVDKITFDRPQLPPVDRSTDSHWLAALSDNAWIPWVQHSFEDRSWQDIGQSPEHLHKVLKDALPNAHYQRICTESAIVLARESPHSQPDIALYATHAGHIGALYTPETILANPEDLFFQRIDGVMTERHRLATASVVIVGLGSLGSAVALALARAGIRRFVLIDPERLTIDNVCRHIGMLCDIGQLKVDVVHKAIINVDPNAEVKVISKRFAWDRPAFSAAAEVDHLLAAETPKAAIISTSAVGRVEAQINELAIRRDVPAIYGAALGAAEHARVFRVFPGKTACYACILSAQDREPSRHPRFALDGAIAEPRRPYVDPSLPGLGLDITIIAMLIARLALQTISGMVEAQVNFGPEDDHILWTNRGGWIFDRPLQVNAEHIPLNPSCKVCGHQSA